MSCRECQKAITTPTFTFLTIDYSTLFAVDSFEFDTWECAARFAARIAGYSLNRIEAKHNT